MKLHPNAKDLRGARFGRLVAIEPNGKSSTSLAWRCKCDCGSETTVRAYSLRVGNTKSCGCLAKESARALVRTHGMTHIPEYGIWRGILKRCTQETNINYPTYGGRGIECRFRNFEEFISHIGRRPSRRHQVDRIDTNGHYEPGNVRWALSIENNRNRRNNVSICYMGVDRLLVEWSEIVGAKSDTLYARYRKGWPPEEILFGRQR